MPLKKYSTITVEEFDNLEKTTDKKIEYNNGEVLFSSSTSQKHNEIITNIISVLKHILPDSCKVYSEMIEVILSNDEETYKYKPDVFVVCGEYNSKGQSVKDIPPIIFEIVSEKYETDDTIKKRLTYEKFGVQEYNVVFQNGNIIQHFFNESYYNIRVCHYGDMFKSDLFYGLNISVDDLLKGDYSKKLQSNIEVAKNLLDVLDDKTIALKTNLSLKEVEKLRNEN